MTWQLIVTGHCEPNTEANEQKIADAAVEFVTALPIECGRSIRVAFSGNHLIRDEQTITVEADE